MSLEEQPFKVVFYFPVRCKLVSEWSEFHEVRVQSSGSIFEWILGKTQAWNYLLHGCIFKSQCIVRDIKPSYLAFRKPVELTLCPSPWNAEVCLSWFPFPSSSVPSPASFLCFSFQWIMDVILCNGLGIYCGMKTLSWLSLKTYKWQGLWNIPTYK